MILQAIGTDHRCPYKMYYSQNKEIKNYIDGAPDVFQGVIIFIFPAVWPVSLNLSHKTSGLWLLSGCGREKRLLALTRDNLATYSSLSL